MQEHLRHRRHIGCRPGCEPCGRICMRQSGIITMTRRMSDRATVRIAPSAASRCTAPIGGHFGRGYRLHLNPYEERRSSGSPRRPQIRHPGFCCPGQSLVAPSGTFKACEALDQTTHALAIHGQSESAPTVPVGADLLPNVPKQAYGRPDLQTARLWRQEADQA